MRIVGRRFSCNINPYFCRKLGKKSQKLSSAAVVIGALRVNDNRSASGSDHTDVTPCNKIDKSLVVSELVTLRNDVHFNVKHGKIICFYAKM